MLVGEEQWCKRQAAAKRRRRGKNYFKKFVIIFV